MPNTHIIEYLQYYAKLENPPHFAVLLSGPWGVGKTYQIKEHIKTLRNSKRKVVYVSLFGVQSTDDFDNSFLLGLLDASDSRATKTILKAGRSLLDGFNIKLDGISTNLAPMNRYDIIVFDDLERAKLSASDILGLINPLVEHDGQKVIIVANEEEIAKSDKDYRRIREKVIGITLQLSEDLSSALDHFISSTDDRETRELLTEKKHELISIFDNSYTQNLRILERSIRSWERLYKEISKELKENNEAITTLLKIVFALSIEIQAGNIVRDDLTNRIENIAAGQMESGEHYSAISMAQKRHPLIPLHDNILPEHLLIQILCEGRIDKSEINESLRASRHFNIPKTAPNWKKIWDSELLDAEEFEAHYAAMMKEFTERHFEEPGETLHVFSLRLWAQSIGHETKSADDVGEECKAYINDLFHEDRLARIRIDPMRYSAHGFGFHERQNPKFHELCNFYNRRSEVLHQKKMPEIAKGLLNDLSGDAQRFKSRVCWSTLSSPPDLVDIPVFSVIDATTFIDKLLECSAKGQRAVLEALHQRYLNGQLNDLLAAERDWFISARNELKARIQNLPAIRRHHLSIDISRLLAPIIERTLFEE